MVVGWHNTPLYAAYRDSNGKIHREVVGTTTEEYFNDMLIKGLDGLDNDDQMVMYHGERVCVLHETALKHHKLKNGMDLNMAIYYNEYRTKGTTTDVLVGRDITAITLSVWNDGKLVVRKRLDYVV